MKHYTVKSKEEAWKKAAELFPTDWEEDTQRSQRAGYPVYSSTASGHWYYWISDINTALELNMGSETVMIDIDMEEAEAEAEAKEQQNADIPFTELKKSYYAQTITADGQTGNINMSGIYTKLIQEAGRICEAYASDILIDINSVEKWLAGRSQSEYAPTVGRSYCFGFRKMGVDHWDFAKNRSAGELYKLYRLDLKCHAGYIHAELYEAEKR